MTTWGDVFSPRQALAIATLARLIRAAAQHFGKQESPDFAEAVVTFCGLALSRFTDICNALCMWETSKTQVRHAFTRQALGMLWDFAEPNVLSDSAGNFHVTLSTMLNMVERCVETNCDAQVASASATAHPLPDDIAHAFVTDPPYYDAVPYAHLSDFFYVWLRRALQDVHGSLFAQSHVPKGSKKSWSIGRMS